MKAIVVYFSHEGNTDWAAKAIARELQADLLRLEPEKAYPTGKAIFLRGGGEASMGIAPALKPFSFDPDKYDTVILGTPMWAWTFAPPLRTFLRKYDLQGKKTGAFVTSIGGQTEKVFAKLGTLTDLTKAPKLSLVEPFKRPDPQNDSAIHDFAEKIRQL